MRTGSPRTLYPAIVLLAGLSLSCSSTSPSSSRDSAHAGHEDDAEGATHEHHVGETVTSMTGAHAHLGPHFRWTPLRLANPADQVRAEAILREVRATVGRYRDYRMAIRDGYEPFLPKVKQPHYHFTSKWRGFKAAFRFNPAEPTSLLYRKTEDGYELEGAMFTAPKKSSEEDLHDRIPLSVAQWHAHVNICLPPRGTGKTADWAKFGPKGSILTKAECDSVDGRFVPQLFGWMVHVYPFADSPEKIWTH